MTNGGGFSILKGKGGEVMPRCEGQKLKLFRILEIFMRDTDENTGLSIAEIISRLDSEYSIRAERKSIYDDFLALGDIGFEVVSLGGRPPKYTIAERIFELPELKMLTDAVQSSKFITAKKSREIIAKLEKFAGLGHAKELSREVYVEDRIKTENSAVIYTIDTVHTAINDNVRISFKYADYNERGERVLRHGGDTYEVSPIALVWSEENYYLVCYDETAKVKKHFRVDKMLSARLLDTKRSAEGLGERFNPAEYSKRVFGMYGGKEELVTLECDKRLAGVVIDRFGTAVRLVPKGEGFSVSVRVMLSPNFYAWVLSFGKDIVIKSPEYVRDDFMQRLREITENYEKCK